MRQPNVKGSSGGHGNHVARNEGNYESGTNEGNHNPAGRPGQPQSRREARATTIPLGGQGNHKGLPLQTRWGLIDYLVLACRFAIDRLAVKRIHLPSVIWHAGYRKRASVAGKNTTHRADRK